MSPLRTSVGPERARDDFLQVIEASLDRTLSIPDPITFALSSRYLGRSIYPRQGTMLKCMFLRDDLFTDYDREVIAGWIDRWRINEDEGTLPDIYERIEMCKAEGRPWFRDTLTIIGRRGGKGYIGGLAGSYVLWHYLCRGNPQYHYGIDKDRHIGFFTFAAKKEMAAKQQWADLSNIITGSQCFRPYLFDRAMADDLRVFAPNDFVRIADRSQAGVAVRPEDMATFEVTPKESTKVSARGPALGAVLFDEMAHVTREVARASADEVWDQAIPALDQMKHDAWIYESSSPEAKTGQFYANSVEAQRVSDGAEGIPAGMAARPEILVFQLFSWDPYIDWERAHEIPLFPGSDECYPRQRQAVQEYDDQMRRLERQNPQRFRTERRSKWLAVADAYLHEERVDAMFEPWPSAEFTFNIPRSEGSLATRYVMHIDPSKVGDNTGLCIGHSVRVKGDQLPHVVLDVIGHWSPGDFPENDNEIDYEIILAEIMGLIHRFMPEEVSFDQGSSSGMMIQTLRSTLARAKLPKRIQVFERTATAPYNWAVAETTKVALQMGCLHAPYDELLKNEMLFLQLVGPKKVDHPTSGPVISKDVWDAASNVCHALIGQEVAAIMGDQFMEVGMAPTMAGGLPLMNATPSAGFEPQRRPVSEVVNQMQDFTRSVARSRMRTGGMPMARPRAPRGR